MGKSRNEREKRSAVSNQNRFTFQVSGGEMQKWLPELMPLLLEMLADGTSGWKRRVALWTLGQLVENTGYVVHPYTQHPTLLDVLLSFLKTEQQPAVR